MNATSHPFPLHRRGAIGVAAGLAAFWTDLARAWTAQEAPAGKARSVIMIFNCGGPSHIDLWDPKPHAGDNIRGPFSPIATSVAGIHVSELLPQLAERMKHLAVLRSVHHKHSSHNSGMHWSTVGRPYRTDNTLTNPSPTDYPSVGTLVGWLAQRDGYSGAVPPYVITPYPHCDSTVYITPGQFGGCLGVRYDPFVLDDDPNSASFRVRNLALHADLSAARLDDRLQLLGQLSAPARAMPSAAAEIDLHRARATSMVLSGDAARAFDLTQEPASVREKYGRHSWGQSHLLARRLVEAALCGTGGARRQPSLASAERRQSTHCHGSRKPWSSRPPTSSSGLRCKPSSTSAAGQPLVRLTLAA